MEHSASVPENQAPVTYVARLLLKNDFEPESFQLFNDIGHTSVALAPCVAVSMAFCKD